MDSALTIGFHHTSSSSKWVCRLRRPAQKAVFPYPDSIGRPSSPWNGARGTATPPNRNISRREWRTSPATILLSFPSCVGASLHFFNAEENVGDLVEAVRQQASAH